jgi:hypothetical protein
VSSIGKSSLAGAFVLNGLALCGGSQAQVWEQPIRRRAQFLAAITLVPGPAKVRRL